MAEVTSQQDRMLALLAVATRFPCAPVAGGMRQPQGNINLVLNPHFEEQKDYWNPFGSGFDVAAVGSRTGRDAALSAVMTNTNQDEHSGAMQVFMHVVTTGSSPPTLASGLSNTSPLTGAGLILHHTPRVCAIDVTTGASSS